jgi:hypothetical protein
VQKTKPPAEREKKSFLHVSICYYLSACHWPVSVCVILLWSVCVVVSAAAAAPERNNFSELLQELLIGRCAVSITPRP